MGCGDSKSSIAKDNPKYKKTTQTNGIVAINANSKPNTNGTNNNSSNKLLKTPTNSSTIGGGLSPNKPVIGNKLIKSPRKSLMMEPKGVESIPILQVHLVEERLNDAFEKDYEIINLIGSGSFGSVYKIKMRNTELIRALKIVKKEIVTFQDDDQQFLKEIEILSQLDHPNILKIYEFFFDGDNYYVITEFIEGGELLEQIYNIKNYCENSAAVIMAQVFSAVNYLHSNNIVHRDLKPENIILQIKNDELDVKIIDFGTANFNSKNSKFTIQYGTSYYLAPEILKNNYNNKCDIWSCGVIMYMILCGQPPFKGKDEDEILKSVERGVYSIKGNEWNVISKEAKDFINKLLSYNPKSRYAANECLSDPWIVNNLVNESVDYDLVLKNLRTFDSTQKLQQFCVAYIIHQISSSDICSSLRDLFKKADKNREGRLKLKDLKDDIEKFYTIHEPGIKIDFNDIINRFDHKNEDYLEYEEFLRATIDLELIITESNLQMAFFHFDKDKSGFISIDNLKKTLGIFFKEEEKEKEKEIVQKILSDAKLNVNGNISYQEFENFMKNSLK